MDKVTAIRDQNAGTVRFAVPGLIAVEVPDNLSGYETLHVLADRLTAQLTPKPVDVPVDVVVEEEAPAP